MSTSRNSAIKVLIFEGSLSPPSFINILISNLSKSGFIYILAGYGKNKIPKRCCTNSNIISLGNSNKFASELPRLVKTAILLLFSNPRAFLQIPKHIFTNKDRWRTKLKVFHLHMLIAYSTPIVIHIQWASHIALFRYLLDNPIDQRPKLIVSLRGRLINISPYADPSLAKLYRDYFPKVDGFHAVSQAIAKEAQRWGAPPQNIRVIYSGLELDKITQHHKFDWNIHTPINILLVGRFHWKKGYYYALDMLRLLLDKGHHIHFTIVAGQATEEIVFQINSLGLKSNISILPNLPHEEVFSHMQSADILLLPSVEEGIANVVLEAMAVGLPVVSSDCGGMAEVIENEVNGLLFQNRNVANMASQLEKMINYSPEDRERMAMLARQRVTQQFGADRLGKEMAAFYEEVCKKN